MTLAFHQGARENLTGKQHGLPTARQKKKILKKKKATTTIYETTLQLAFGIATGNTVQIRSLVEQDRESFFFFY